MADKMMIVIELDNPDHDGIRLREILQAVKPLFADRGDVKVYGAVRETADAIYNLLQVN